MESRCTFALKETAVITVAGILIVSLSTATGQSVDRCDPNSVKVCYAMYMTVLWREEFKPSPEGEYDEEELKRGCSIIKAKSPCHQRLANCSEAVTGDLRIQERGYEAMRNIICDVNSLKASPPGAAPASFPSGGQSRPRMARLGRAGLTALGRCERDLSENPAEIACFDKAFNSSCPLSMETAKAAVTRVVNAAALLKGCESSSNAVVVSGGFLVLLVVPVILSWLRT
ncbi:uncharacterized protein LOC119372081 [Rhipicephalus sanguineus]|uniref:uncharacterized protein LOC119372081 n=1 Tax=Rhipicephalus sanguineus TaxID=34632 RepID=UPI0020C55B7B|nr:uncharacterized protein LOC119372081 [Rhipicephalus sanguineus]